MNRDQIKHLSTIFSDIAQILLGVGVVPFLTHNYELIIAGRFFVLSLLFLVESVHPSYAGLQPKGLSKQLRGSYTRAHSCASGVHVLK